MFVKTKTDVVLHLRKWCCGDHVLVFIHGLGDNGDVWRSIIKRLSISYSCVTVDLRGHGDSEWDPKCDYTVEMYIDDVLQAIESLSATSLMLIGHSLGGEIAVRIADKIQPRLWGLVLVDWGPVLNDEALLRAKTNLVGNFRLFRSVDEYVKVLEEQRYFSSQETLHQIAQYSLVPYGKTFFRLRLDPAILSVDYKDDSEMLWKLLKHVRCPTLLLRGEGSAVLSNTTARQMIQCNANLSMQQVKSSGHAVMTDNPRVFEEKIESFIENVKPKS